MTRPSHRPDRGEDPRGPLGDDELASLDAYWRAANYLSVGQIYLLDNPLLREPLRPEHVKPRLLGHWGTTPGPEPPLRAPQPGDQRRATWTPSTSPAPATAGPASWPTPTWRAPTPRSTRTSAGTPTGMRRLFRQFSFPGGIPSHVAPETPGSIHEGGELGYALVHAYGAAFDNPDLVVACVIGDGEAETGPLAASWHSNKFLDPARDGAVLPILHLNGYKIANPTVLARIPEDELLDLLRGYGHRPYVVAGDDPADVHQQLAAALDDALDEIAAIQRARPRRRTARAPALADDRAAHAEGLDRPDGGRRPAGRGHLPRPPGAAGRGARRTRRTWPSSRSGCAATGPRSCSTPTAPLRRTWRALRAARASGG